MQRNRTALQHTRHSNDTDKYLMDLLKRWPLIMFLMLCYSTRISVVAFLIPKSQPHKVSQSGLRSSLINSMVEINTGDIMWTVAFGAAAYFSTYTTDGYEPHAM
mmetsp:Transcript_11267/g.12899  ORF Transcript_11267/g.12899 Transcript_11267/m.12899 type:complete len:104 (-) Transcript_11267:365-676(-)